MTAKQTLAPELRTLMNGLASGLPGCRRRQRRWVARLPVPPRPQWYQHYAYFGAQISTLTEEGPVGGIYQGHIWHRLAWIASREQGIIGRFEVAVHAWKTSG